MDDQLDNDLKNRIREVFDNYEDPSADEGWLLLRQRFPEQRRRRALAWIWWSAAAVLLVFLGIGLWVKNEQDNPRNLIVKTIKHLRKGNITTQKVAGDSVDNSSLVVGQSVSGKQSAHNFRAGLTLPATVNNVAGKPHNRVAQGLPLADTAVKNIFIAKKTADSLRMVINKADQPQLAANNVSQSENPKLIAGTEKKPQRSIMDMFKEDKNVKAQKKEEALPSKAVRFGVYAATYFNYSKGSDNQVNVGAGVTSDIKITKNLKLVTGIAIAQNSLSYAGVPSAAASAKSNLFASSPVAASNTFMALSTPTVKNYNASLVGLDIPVNLKYEFNPQKSDMYISAGLSSGTFIDESYTYKYNYPSFLSPTLQETRDETTGKNFSSFYFAKTLNVSFGVGYPFGKNRLVIEPFLKYPLDGMGSQNLRFGAGGLNLKFNFLSSHK